MGQTQEVSTPVEDSPAMLPDFRTITLTMTFDQLRLIEHGINAELCELSEFPPTNRSGRWRESLLDLRSQIDEILEGRAEAFRQFDKRFMAAQAQNPT